MLGSVSPVRRDTVARGKYIRFTVQPRKGKWAAEDGIFVAAYALARGDELTAAARDHLVDLLTWFSLQSCCSLAIQ